MTDYDKGYDEGFKQGLAASEFTDGYWARQYAGQAMQAVISEVTWGVDDANFHQPPVDRIAITSVAIAKALLEEVKKHDQTR